MHFTKTVLQSRNDAKPGCQDAHMKNRWGSPRDHQAD